MNSPTQSLLDFVMAVRFESLPREVVKETKRIILDSIGVAVAGLKADKGRYGIALAKRFGGPAESTILGTRDRVACGSAAFANGELINALDYDPMLFPTHAPPCLIPASLAIGEMSNASGKDMILATAIGGELSQRLSVAVRGLKKTFDKEKGSEVGKIPGTKHSVSALGMAVIAGAAGAGKLMNLNRQKMSHAVGLATHFMPLPQAKWKQNQIMSMTKYICSGWASHAEVTAVFLADMGYTADTSSLDGDLGAWRFFGSDRWNPDALTEQLGTEWKMLEGVEYKPYPSARPTHVPLDCFFKIIYDNNLMLEDIELVSIKTEPTIMQPLFKNKKIGDHIAAQFSLPYLIAAAANRVSPAEWQNPDKLRDPNILKFMDRVFQEARSPSTKDELEGPHFNPTVVEVTAKGRTFKQEGRYSRGHATPPSCRMKDEELIDKFRANTSIVLPQKKVDKAVTSLMGLEKVESLAELIKNLMP